ncbi:hypothetical protein BKA70DRAFT_1343169 [Coprinopsis sp. MPI-PUGE-AT-0042]|nr:hypothetical protein BKA70DRAFT_1343169 [Coprinopsis sp. MPI-PUGE-AT-0042]
MAMLTNAARALSGAAIITGGALLAPAVAVGALGAVGFTAGGVAAGSLAAAVQSAVWGATTGGVFSALQAAGATMVAPAAQVVGGVGAVAAGALGLKKL